MGISLGSNNLGYPEFGGGDAKVYYGNKLMINKASFANWSPISSSDIYGFYSSNNNVSGSYNTSNGTWNSITGSTIYNLTASSTVRALIDDNPNYIQAPVALSGSYFNQENNNFSEGWILQFWVRINSGSTDSYLFRNYPDTNNINLYFNSSLTYVYWGMDTRPAPRSYKLVSSSIDPAVWTNQWHNIAFSFNAGSGGTSVSRKLYVDGAKVQEWNIGETNNLGFSDTNRYLGGSTSTSFNGSCESIVVYKTTAVDNGDEEYTVLTNYNNSKYLFEFQ